MRKTFHPPDVGGDFRLYQMTHVPDEGLLLRPVQGISGFPSATSARDFVEQNPELFIDKTIRCVKDCWEVSLISRDPVVRIDIRERPKHHVKKEEDHGAS